MSDIVIYEAENGAVSVKLDRAAVVAKNATTAADGSMLAPETSL